MNRVARRAREKSLALSESTRRTRSQRFYYAAVLTRLFNSLHGFLVQGIFIYDIVRN